MNDGHPRGEPSSSYTGVAFSDDLAVRLSDLARQLQDERSIQDTLDAIVTVAVDTVPGAQLAGLMVVERDNLGALNLYSRDVDAFDDESEHIGLLFASHAAIAMSGARQADQLSRAVAVRELIGQAKGILMERHRLTADQAFVLLVRASQATNTKLVDVARHLTETGEL